MGETTQIGCSCGKTRLEVEGKPIASVECCCSSCRQAAARIGHLDGAPPVLTDYNATPFVMYRKDRVRFVAGAENLKSFRCRPTRQPSEPLPRAATRLCIWSSRVAIG